MQSAVVYPAACPILLHMRNSPESNALRQLCMARPTVHVQANCACNGLSDQLCRCCPARRMRRPRTAGHRRLCLLCLFRPRPLGGFVRLADRFKRYPGAAVLHGPHRRLCLLHQLNRFMRTLDRLACLRLSLNVRRPAAANLVPRGRRPRLLLLRKTGNIVGVRTARRTDNRGRSSRLPRSSSSLRKVPFVRSSLRKRPRRGSAGNSQQRPVSISVELTTTTPFSIRPVVGRASRAHPFRPLARLPCLVRVAPDPSLALLLPVLLRLGRQLFQGGAPRGEAPRRRPAILQRAVDDVHG